MSDKQMVWHAYHAGSLCQLVNIEDRRMRIEHIKPKNELPTRRRLMKVVVGELPVEFVAACKKEDASLWATYAVYEALWKAREVAYETHKAEIERLHAEECPDCPWDGESIFPEMEGGMRA